MGKSIIREKSLTFALEVIELTPAIAKVDEPSAS